MSKNGKSPAWKAAKAAEAKLQNNPFQPETRPHQMFESLRRHSDDMNFHFEEMEEVYGSVGTPRTRADNPSWAETQTCG
jgi:hypothetical protein